jgi:hypothetical protein
VGSNPTPSASYKEKGLTGNGQALFFDVLAAGGRFKLQMHHFERQ